MRARLHGLALVAVGALVLALAQGPVWRFLRAGGAPGDQRPLAGADAAVARVARGPVRVVLLDGLAADDARRVPAFEQVCARGLVLAMDVGFPTKSLPAQFALWTGLTAAQAGLSFDNDPMPVPPHAIPAQVPGSIAVVESSRGIAGSFGFTTLEPDAGADAEPDGPSVPDAVRVAAWRAHGFAAAAADAAAGPALLAFVHVLAIDDAAHAGGRSSAAYDRALAYADGVLAQVAAHTPRDAALVVLADHGHVARGGHGDAEPEVRFVRACIAPAPVAERGPAPIHLIDLARYLADRTGATLDADARGRPLAAAIAHADPDATMPSPGAARWLAALIAIAVIVTFAARALARGGAPRWLVVVSLAWPLASLALAALVPGLPTLSRRPRPSLAWITTALPIAALVPVARTRTRSVAWIAPPCALALGCALLTGVPGALAGGVPARVPWWTGELLFWLAQTAAALAAAGLALVVRTPDSPRAYPSPVEESEPASGARTASSADRTTTPPG